MSLDGDVAARDFDIALAGHCVLEGASVIFHAFVAFETVTRLSSNVQSTARNFEAALALNAVIASHHGDVAVLNFKIVAGLNTVFEISSNRQLSSALDVQIILRINCSLCGILFAIDRSKHMATLAIFYNVGRSLDQMDNSLVSVFHKNRSVGTLQSRIVKIDAGIAFFIGTRSIHHNLEIGRFASHVIGARASDRCAFVFDRDATVVVFDSCRCSSKFQEDLRAVQSSSIIQISFVFARIRTTGTRSSVIWIKNARTRKTRNYNTRTRNSRDKNTRA